MPEGDTILRAARALGRALEGRTVVSVRSALPSVSGGGLAGRRILRVEARGKNLLFHFDDGRALHSHMRMSGSWHLYRPAERWRKPERFARAVLETDEFVAVCFHAPVIELLSPRELARHPSLSRLGPDILAREFDLARAAAGLRCLVPLSIGEALLAQSAVAGIGNIYKSEALFVGKTSPFAPLAQLEDARIERVLLAARGLMSANLSGEVRATRGFAGGRYWVYGRSGRPCFVCSTGIRMRRQGDAGRSTYWCPRCQPLSDPGDRREGAATKSNPYP
jgi:endonuclease VIII